MILQYMQSGIGGLELPIIIYLWILQKISGISGKNHFYKMNGDIGMAGWYIVKYEK